MTQSTMFLRFAVSVILCAAVAEFTSAQPAKVAEIDESTGALLREGQHVR